MKPLLLCAFIALFASCTPEALDAKINVQIDFTNARSESVIRFSNGSESVIFQQSDGILQTKKVRASMLEVTYSITNSVNNSCFYYFGPVSESWEMRLHSSGGDSTGIHPVETNYRFFENCR